MPTILNHVRDEVFASKLTENVCEMFVLMMTCYYSFVDVVNVNASNNLARKRLLAISANVTTSAATKMMVSSAQGPITEYVIVEPASVTKAGQDLIVRAKPPTTSASTRRTIKCALVAAFASVVDAYVRKPITLVSIATSVPLARVCATVTETVFSVASTKLDR